MNENFGAWQRQHPRMLLVHPVQQLVQLSPGIAAAVLWGLRDDGDPRIAIAAFVVPVLWGMVRWLTTRFRVDGNTLQIRRGLLRRSQLHLTVPRIRSVEWHQPLLVRLLGLVSLQLNTSGMNHGRRTDHVRLTGLSPATARALSARLGKPATAHHDEPATDEELLFTGRPGWARYAPLSGSGYTLVLLGLLSVVTFSASSWTLLLSPPVVRLAEHLGWWGSLLAGVAAITALAAICSMAGYLLNAAVLRLRLTPESIDVRYGRLAKRVTSVDRRRFAGVCLRTPWSVRLLGGARVTVIATSTPGHPSNPAGMLVPAAPLSEAVRVCGTLTGLGEEFRRPLQRHGRAARHRRLGRAVAGASLVIGAGALAAGRWGWAWLPQGGTAVVASGGLLLASVLVGLDRHRSTGHRLVGATLLIGGGSVRRTRVAVRTGSVLGWKVRQSLWQRRSGLLTLTAMTTAGEGGYRILDIPVGAAANLVREVTPRLAASRSSSAAVRLPSVPSAGVR